MKGVFFLWQKGNSKPRYSCIPYVKKTVEQMSKISGIGENKLRELMDSSELTGIYTEWKPPFDSWRCNLGLVS